MPRKYTNSDTACNNALFAYYRNQAHDDTMMPYRNHPVILSSTLEKETNAKANEDEEIPINWFVLLP